MPANARFDRDGTENAGPVPLPMLQVFPQREPSATTTLCLLAWHIAYYLRVVVSETAWGVYEFTIGMELLETM